MCISYESYNEIASGMIISEKFVTSLEIYIEVTRSLLQTYIFHKKLAKSRHIINVKNDPTVYNHIISNIILNMSNVTR